MSVQISQPAPVSVAAPSDLTSSSPNIPPFPTDIPIAPLTRLSLARLRSDKAESNCLYNASKTLGFFCLDLRDDTQGKELLSEAEKLFRVGEQLHDLGREELVNYD